MELEELIEEISDIKKKLANFEDMVLKCIDIDDKTLIDICGYKESAYDNLADIEDILSEMEFKKRELEDKGE